MRNEKRQLKDCCAGVGEEGEDGEEAWELGRRKGTLSSGVELMEGSQYCVLG